MTTSTDESAYPENVYTTPPTRNFGIVALQRFAELLKYPEQIIELLQIYTPEEIITHMKTCNTTPCPCQQVSIEGQHCEKSALLAEVAEKYTLAEIDNCFKFSALAKLYGCNYDNVASALRQRRQHNEQQARYYSKRKEESKKYRQNTQC